MKKIRQIFENIANGGVTPYLTTAGKISLRNANLILFGSILFVLIFTIIALSVNLVAFAMVMLFANIGLICGVGLLRSGYLDEGKFVAWFFGNIVVFSVHDLLAPALGSGLFYLVLVFCPLAVFPERPKVRKFLAFLAFVFWILSGQIPPHLFFNPGTAAVFFPSWFLQISGGLLLVALFIHLTSNLQESLIELQMKNSEMTRSSQMIVLGEMAGGIAHEINNPLQSILGRAEIISVLATKGASKEKLIEEAEKIISTVERISKIISGLRTFSRTPELVPRKKQKLCDLLSEVIELCQVRFQRNQLQIRINVDLNLYITCNAIELSQVFLNLLNNSYDAVHELPTPWIEISAEKGEHSIRIFVTDSGSGIPADYADKIMKPFFTTKELGQGTGLGLSISKGIVESHGGRLYYDPTCSNTRFVIELPQESEEV